MTPGVCPYTRTQSASSDTPESAQLIRRIEELMAENRQIRQELVETKQQVRVKDELIFELIKRPPEQTAPPAETNKNRRILKTAIELSQGES
jgi:hypothetical protein